MQWTKPNHSKGSVDRAGRIMVDAASSEDEKRHATGIVNNWRASHNYPLNTFKVTLRKKAQDVGIDPIVAQRIKRMSSIEAKLLRSTSMRMSQMQDIGGCRVILDNLGEVEGLVKKYQTSDLKHTLDDIDDYLLHPKESGYRGVHLIYKYFSDKQAPAIYNGLYIEIQMRTRLQHAWATSVETVGTFLKQSLKSSQGEEDWLRFFSLIGSVFAIKEGSPALVPNTPPNFQDLQDELRHYSAKLNVSYALNAYQRAIQVAREGPQSGNQYYLLTLEPKQQQITVRGYSRRQLEEASTDYLDAEKRILENEGSEAVLVSVDSLASLERAYPNYFLDTTFFLNELQDVLAS